MGYYTQHKLVVKNPSDSEKIHGALYEKSGYGDDLFDTSCKWYSQDEDCKAVSAQFPDVLFAIEGDGEEQGDIWRRSYLGGEMTQELRPEPFKFPDL